LVRKLRRRLQDHVHAYLLRNHGLICAAAGLAEGVSLVGRIEHAAAAFLHQYAVRLPAAHALRQLALASLTSADTL
jgi:L-fuculose-phosphate aldolase